MKQDELDLLKTNCRGLLLHGDKTAYVKYYDEHGDFNYFRICKKCYQKNRETLEKHEKEFNKQRSQKNLEKSMKIDIIAEAKEKYLSDIKNENELERKQKHFEIKIGKEPCIVKLTQSPSLRWEVSIYSQRRPVIARTFLFDDDYESARKYYEKLKKKHYKKKKKEAD